MRTIPNTDETRTIDFGVGQSTLGHVLVAQGARGIVAIFLGDDARALEDSLAARFHGTPLRRAQDKLAPAVARVIATIENPGAGFDGTLDVRGTPFQRRVWDALRDIPCGTTLSYSEVARRIGVPRSVRAVASAIAANAHAVVIPCHRVVRSDGALSGYRWGVERKRALLQREAGA